MKIVCAWCGKDMGEKDGRGVEGVTHGQCKQCFTKFMAKLESNTSARDKQDGRKGGNKGGTKLWGGHYLHAD